jgi:hypothetical protein
LFIFHKLHLSIMDCFLKGTIIKSSLLDGWFDWIIIESPVQRLPRFTRSYLTYEYVQLLCSYVSYILCACASYVHLIVHIEATYYARVKVVVTQTLFCRYARGGKVIKDAYVTTNTAINLKILIITYICLGSDAIQSFKRSPREKIERELIAFLCNPLSHT